MVRPCSGGRRYSILFTVTDHPSSSTIIENLKTLCDGPDRAIGYFYFDFSDSRKQKVPALLSSILAQLCDKAGSLDHLKSHYDNCNHGCQQPSVQQLCKMLSSTIPEFKEVFLVIDALDECTKGEERSETLAVIERISSWSLPNLHVLITSRSELDIVAVLEKLANENIIAIDESRIGSDINHYIKAEVAADSKLQKWPNDVKQNVEEVLCNGANGM